MIRYAGMDAIGLLIIMAVFFILYVSTPPEIITAYQPPDKPNAWFHDDINYYIHESGELGGTTEGAEERRQPDTRWRRYQARPNPMAYMITQP